uniref:Uncharacterized protein n=1 Tax=Arundo donax TaxID=35708 RepID=A0A0A8ZXF6_ARUDO
MLQRTVWMLTWEMRRKFPKQRVQLLVRRRCPTAIAVPSPLFDLVAA